MEQLIIDTNLAAIRRDPALASACLLRARAIVAADQGAEPTRHAAARFLWSETDAPREFARRMQAIEDGGGSDAAAIEAIDWCARHACCDLHWRRIARAARSRGADFLALLRQTALALRADA